MAVVRCPFYIDSFISSPSKRNLFFPFKMPNFRSCAPTSVRTFAVYHSALEPIIVFTRHSANGLVILHSRHFDVYEVPRVAFDAFIYTAIASPLAPDLYPRNEAETRGIDVENVFPAK